MMNRADFLHLPIIGWFLAHRAVPSHVAPATPVSSLPKKGDVVTCRNGHRIWMFRRDIRMGDTVRSDIVVGVGGHPSPKDGTKMAVRCRHCNTPTTFLERGSGDIRLWPYNTP